MVKKNINFLITGHTLDEAGRRPEDDVKYQKAKQFNSIKIMNESEFEDWL